VPDGHELITEGQINMIYPKVQNSVFYNPVQVQNRDLSVLMLGMYAERRMDRMWTTRKRKEVRKAMVREMIMAEVGGGSGDGGGKGGKGGKGGDDFLVSVVANL
jgi:tRNA G26 N,N-dimethylase Trm1